MTRPATTPSSSATLPGPAAARTGAILPPAWVWGALLALSAVASAGSFALVRHVAADAMAVLHLRALESAAEDLHEAVLAGERAPAGLRSDLARHATALSRELRELPHANPDDPIGWIWGFPLSPRELEDLSRDWRRLQPLVSAVSSLPPTDPAHRLAVDELEANMPRLLRRVSQRDQAMLDHIQRVGRAAFASSALAAVMVAAGLGLLLWSARVRSRREKVEGRRKSHAACTAELGPGGLVLLDTAFRVLWANDAFAAMAGESGVSLVGRGLLPMLAPGADSGEARRVLREELAAGTDVIREWGFTDRTGRTRRVEIRLRRAGDEPGDAITGVVHDLTARAEADRHGRDHERLFQLAVETMPDGLVLHASDGRIDMCNPGAERILGLPAHRIVGTNANEFFSRLVREDGTPFEEHHDPASEALRTGQPSVGRVVGVRRPDGQALWLRVTHTPVVRDGETSPYAVLCTFSDVTMRRQAEQAIRKLTQTVEQSPVAVVITDAHGSIEYVNRQFQRVSGFESEEVIGRNPRVLASGETPRATYSEMWAALSAGREWRGTVWNRRRNGDTYPAALSIFPLRDEAGRQTHYVAFQQDMDEARRREHELRDVHSASVRAMRERAEFLQNLSREMIGPLECITRSADDLMPLTSGTATQTGVRRIGRASEQLLAMIHQLFDLSWLEGGDKGANAVPFRLRALLREVISSFARDGRKLGEMPTMDVEADVPDALEGDAAALRQLVWALAGDAAHGVRGPRVEVRVAHVVPGPGRSRLRFEVRRWGMVLSAARLRELERILADPSIAAPAANDLGPALAARLAAHLGGRIEYASAGAGCDVWSFELEFGVVEIDEAPRLERPEAGCRVLVVDGGAEPGNGLLERLALLGLAVTRADDADSARARLANADAAGTPFAAILVEARPGAVDPFAIAAHLVAGAGGRPEPVLLLTGGGDRGDAERCRRLGVYAYLAMPFGDLDLTEALAIAIARAPAPLPVTRHWLREHRRPRVVGVAGAAAAATEAADMLERSGYTVARLAGVDEARARAREGGFDAWVTFASGEGAVTPASLAAMMRDALAAGPKPACLVLDAEPSEDWADAGADAFLPLPVAMDVLLGVLQPLTGERPRGDARESLAPEVPLRAA